MQKGVDRSGRFEIDKERKVFIKYLAESKFQSERDMSKLGAEVGQTSGLFSTPTLIQAYSDKCVLEFELLEHTSTLRNYFIEMAGIDFPDGFIEDRFSETSVLLHGDFTLGNLLYDSTSETLNIIDWSISPVFDFAANHGPRYWDLSFFISSLFFYSYSTYFSFNMRVDLTKSFLVGYLAENDLDRQTFVRELADFVSLYNYYDLYDGHKKVKRTLSEQFLIRRSLSKLQALIQRLPDLIT